MKKLFVIIFLFSFFQTVNSQTVNNVPIKDIDVEYIQIVGTTRLASTKVTVEIDFGQFNSAWTNKDTQILDENGVKVVFNSMIDALNFMSKNGYDFKNAYTISINGQNVYHFLLQKKH